MEDMLSVGVIGCGAISVNHFKALEQLSGVRLAAVCDIDPERLCAAAGEQGAKPYAGYRDLLSDPGIDAVHICTPHYLHPQMAIDALRAGKHVLCEKPMAIHAADGEQMLAAARESGKQLGVCFQNRYNAASRRIRRLLDSGELGAVLGGNAVVTWDRGESYYARGAWRGRWETEGGAVLINQAIHTFDLLRDFAGEIVEVRCSMSAKRLADVIEAEDTCDMLLFGRQGQRFLFYASNCGVGNTPISMTLVLEGGVIQLNGNRVTVLPTHGEPISEDFTSGVAFGKDYWGSGHGFLIEDFYRCIKQGEPFPIGPEEAMKTTVLLEKAYTQPIDQRRRPI